MITIFKFFFNSGINCPLNPNNFTNKDTICSMESKNFEQKRSFLTVVSETETETDSDNEDFKNKKTVLFIFQNFNSIIDKKIKYIET